MVLHGQLGHHPIIPALPSCPYGIAGQHHEDDRFKDSAASNPLTSDQSRGGTVNDLPRCLAVVQLGMDQYLYSYHFYWDEHPFTPAILM